MNTEMNDSVNFDTILLETKQAFRKNRSQAGCVSTETLVDYAYGDLGQDAHGAVKTHVGQCNDCRLTLLRIDADRLEWEKLLEVSPDEAMSKSLGKSGKAFVDGKIRKKPAPSVISSLQTMVKQWMSPLWEPMWAGQTVTAADIPEQLHRFDMGDGEYINIRCFWGSKAHEAGAQIEVAWEANLYIPSIIWLRFVDPETEEVFCETCLGNELTGKQLIGRDPLGFDPSTRRFALSVIIEAI